MGLFDHKAIWITAKDREWLNAEIIKESKKAGRQVTQPEFFNIMRSKYKGDEGK